MTLDTTLFTPVKLGPYELPEPDPKTFYGRGKEGAEQGYTDYAFLQAS